MKKNLYGLPVFLIFVTVLSVSAFTYTKAEGVLLEVCVKKSGLIYVIGEDFRRSECKKNDALLSWNTSGIQGSKGDTGPQGIKGDKGDVGPQGEKAAQGAGNIAFCSIYNDCASVLKTDGTIWDFNGNDVWAETPNFPKTVPVPVSNIVHWERYSFLDVDGNVWRWGNNRWNNIGHPNSY